VVGAGQLEQASADRISEDVECVHPFNCISLNLYKSRLI